MLKNKYILLCFISVYFICIQGVAVNSSTNVGKITVFADGRRIADNSIVYINDSPEMPHLTAEYRVKQPEKITWHLKVIFKRPNRNEVPSFTKTVKGSNILNLDKLYKRKYIGGIALLKATDSYGKESYFTFHIRAKNPAEHTVYEYIGTNPWYARAIAKHESGQQNNQYFCQFNEVGILGADYISDVKYTPNRSSDKTGWGIFQITMPEPDHSELWNWKKNVDKGISILDFKRTLAQAYFTAVKLTYPDKYEPPPNYIPPGQAVLLLFPLWMPRQFSCIMGLLCRNHC